MKFITPNNTRHYRRILLLAVPALAIGTLYLSGNLQDKDNSTQETVLTASTPVMPVVQASLQETIIPEPKTETKVIQEEIVPEKTETKEEIVVSEDVIEKKEEPVPFKKIKTPEKETKKEVVKLDNALDSLEVESGFHSLKWIERFISKTDVHSSEINLIRPELATGYDKGIIFEWEAEGKTQVSYIEVFTASTEGNPARINIPKKIKKLTLTRKFTPDLYYWRMVDQTGETLFLGKFIVSE